MRNRSQQCRLWRGYAIRSWLPVYCIRIGSVYVTKTTIYDRERDRPVNHETPPPTPNYGSDGGARPHSRPTNPVCLPPICIRKEVVNSGLNAGYVRIKKRAVLEFLVLAVALGALIPIDGLAKPCAPPGWQHLIHQVSSYHVDRIPMNAWVEPLFQQRLPNWFSDLVKFFPLVTTNGKPIAQKQAEQKRGGVEQRELNGISEYVKEYWVHWLFMPLLWFFLGVALGGGFERRK